METRLSILFYGKKTGMHGGKSLPIYMRVTIEGHRFEISTNRYVEPSKWFSQAGKVKGNTEEARTINNYLDTLPDLTIKEKRSFLRLNKGKTLEFLLKKYVITKKEIGL